MQQLSQKTSTFTDSVIRRMTRISNEYNAINLSQGFPDFEPPRPILDRLSYISTHPGEGDFNQYAVTWGAQNFREGVAKKYGHFSGQKRDPNTEIVVTCGSTEAMMASMLSVVNPGDKVIIFSPFYENYGADTILCGAEPVFVSLRAPEYKFDANELEDAFRTGAKALVLCNPSNPCGKVFTREELLIIAGLAQKYDAYVITDEVYEHIVYDDHKHIYFSTLPGMKDRTIVCSSLSKTYSITGWRLGYTIANPEVTDRIKKTHDFLTVGAAAPLQEAAVTGLNFDYDYYEALQKKYAAKRRLMLEGLTALKIPHSVPEGAYYIMLDISEFGYESDLDFATDLIRKVGVGTVPGSSFFKEKENRYVRIHFAKKDDTLNSALERLEKIHLLSR